MTEQLPTKPSGVECQNGITDLDSAGKARLLETLIQEYQTLYNERVNRINLQNTMVERAINLTLLTATLLGAIFSFLLKDTPTSTAASTRTNLDLFATASLPILFAYGVLAQMTVAGWIYQLSIIFRMTRYWKWVAVNRFDRLLGVRDSVFLWDRAEDPSWLASVDKGIVKYFQTLFLYVLCSFSLLGLLAVILCKATWGTLGLAGLLGTAGLIGLTVSLFVLGTIHRRVSKLR